MSAHSTAQHRIQGICWAVLTTGFTQGSNQQRKTLLHCTCHVLVQAVCTCPGVANEPEEKILLPDAGYLLRRVVLLPVMAAVKATATAGCEEKKTGRHCCPCTNCQATFSLVPTHLDSQATTHCLPCFIPCSTPQLPPHRTTTQHNTHPDNKS